MAMKEATLSSGLKSLGQYETEDEAVAALVAVYATYVAEAQALTPILPLGVEAGKNAMVLALEGIKESVDISTGAIKLVAAVNAFWGAVSLGLTASFAGAVAVVPPLHASMVGDLIPLLTDNLANNRSLSDAVDAIAGIWHNQTVSGGKVITPPNISTPIV